MPYTATVTLDRKESVRGLKGEYLVYKIVEVEHDGTSTNQAEIHLDKGRLGVYTITQLVSSFTNGGSGSATTLQPSAAVGSGFDSADLIFETAAASATVNNQSNVKESRASTIYYRSNPDASVGTGSITTFITIKRGH